MKRLILKISGEVQGVFFRHTAKEKAEKLGLVGCATNEFDGSLMIEVDGQENAARKFAEWCKRGPPSAKVLKIDITEAEPVGYKSFIIR